MDMEKLAEAIAPLIVQAVDRATKPLHEKIAAMESREPIKGEKGDAGKDGSPGADGRDGIAPSLDDVANEVSLRYERRFADHCMTWERMAREMAEKAIDRMPVPADGSDGKDGRDFEQPVFEYDGRRTFTVSNLTNGEMVERTFTLPLVIDAGFYQEGSEYSKGDGVTFGGSYWIAQKDTTAKPEIGSDEWRLAVKKGRDARGNKL